MNPEYAIVAQCLYDERAMPVCVQAGLEPLWFTDQDARWIWEQAFGSFACGKWMDITLASQGIEKKYGAVPRWIQDSYDNSALALMGDYIGVVRAKWIKRRMIVIVKQAQEQIEDKEDADQARAKLIADLQAIGEAQTNREPLRDIAERLLNEWSNPASTEKLNWPLSKMNLTIGPMTDELVYLAASESLGKTAFALQWALNQVWSLKVVSIRSLESSRDKLTSRLLAMTAMVNTWRMRIGRGKPEEFESARAALPKFTDMEKYLRINDAGATIDQISAWALVEKHAGSKALIIDNLKHIRSSRRYDSPVEMFRDFSLRLKWIRDDVKLPIIVLHHTSADGDVSWCRDIRRDTDILIFMREDEDNSVAPDIGNGYTGKTIVDFQVDKNREGLAGASIKTEFNKPNQTFTEWPSDGLEGDAK